MPHRPPRPTRRRFLRAAGVGGLAVAAGRGQDPLAPPPDPTAADADAAVDRGLAYLAARQAADGSFADTRTGQGNVAVTALAGLALLSAGHHPGRGRYGAAVAKAARYVAGRAGPAGYLAADDPGAHTGMYQHGFGALFLSEVHGTLPDPAVGRLVRDRLEKAVALTVAAQNREGGWRYEPRPVFKADVSVTVAQLMALRAARNAGLAVPKSAVDRCVDYIRKCQQPDGGFCYVLGQRAGSAFPRSAAAVVGLFSAGVYAGDAIDRGLAYLARYRPGGRPFPVGRDDDLGVHYYYAQYYAALAMWTAGGRWWADWYPAARDALLARAVTPDRVWDDRFHGAAYATAMACIVLQLPNNYLPIMQK